MSWDVGVDHYVTSTMNFVHILESIRDREIDRTSESCDNKARLPSLSLSLTMSYRCCLASFVLTIKIACSYHTRYNSAINKEHYRCEMRGLDASRRENACLSGLLRVTPLGRFSLHLSPNLRLHSHERQN